MNANEQWVAFGNGLWEFVKWLISFGGQLEIAKDHPFFAMFGWVASIGAVIYAIKKIYDWLHP